MGSFSIWHWLIVGLLILVLFGGRGKISDIMGDFAKGIKAFKKGMSEDDTTPASTTTNPVTPAEPLRSIDHQAPGTRTQEPAPSAAGAPFGDRKLG